MSKGETKHCVACGRVIEWRNKWKNNWTAVKYCSDRCRKNKVTDEDRRLEQTILDLLSSRARDATICPSEAARAFYDEDSWRERMETVRQAARRLVNQGKAVITQKGKVVDPSTAKGPIRIRRK